MNKECRKRDATKYRVKEKTKKFNQFLYKYICLYLLVFIYSVEYKIQRSPPALFSSIFFLLLLLLFKYYYYYYLYFELIKIKFTFTQTKWHLARFSRSVQEITTEKIKRTIFEFEKNFESSPLHTKSLHKST